MTVLKLVLLMQRKLINLIKLMMLKQNYASRFWTNCSSNSKTSNNPKIKKAEKESVHGEFSEKVNEIITGTVQRVENNNYLINLGRTKLFYTTETKS